MKVSMSLNKWKPGPVLSGKDFTAFLRHASQWVKKQPKWISGVGRKMLHVAK